MSKLHTSEVMFGGSIMIFCCGISIAAWYISNKLFILACAIAIGNLIMRISQQKPLVIRFRTL